jgi:hypothetical protein
MILFFYLYSGAPVYISNPHFYQSNPKFLNEVEGLEPNQDLHETYLKIQPVIYMRYLTKFFIIYYLMSYRLSVFQSKVKFAFS